MFSVSFKSVKRLHIFSSCVEVVGKHESPSNHILHHTTDDDALTATDASPVPRPPLRRQQPFGLEAATPQVSDHAS